jgi:hypothetical protein
MTQDEIIEIARQAGLYQDINVSFHQALRNFYNLAAAKEQKKWQDQTEVEIHEAVLKGFSLDEEKVDFSILTFAKLVDDKATAKEREACANQVQSWNTAITDQIALAIRARTGEQA